MSGESPEDLRHMAAQDRADALGEKKKDEKDTLSDSSRNETCISQESDLKVARPKKYTYPGIEYTGNLKTGCN